MSNAARVEEIVSQVLAMAERERKLTGFCIGNTSKVDSSGLFFTPIRNTAELIAGSVIVYEAHRAAEIAALVDGRVQYLFVDSEKKTGPDAEFYGPSDKGNIERAIRDVVKASTILTYKGNDLTVDSIDCLLVQLVNDPVRGIGGKKAVIIGAGNLGSKLALKLVERGATVVLTRRNKEKLDAIVTALNYIKPVQTLATVTGTTDSEAAAKGADVLIGMASGVPVITKTMIEGLSSNAVVIDAGKGCLFPDAIQRASERNLKLFRVDVRSGFAGQVAMLLQMARQLGDTIGRRAVNGVHIVSGGLFAWEHEIVVDNVNNPRAVYGVADGRGDFIRALSPAQAASVKAVSDYIARAPNE